MKKITYNDIRNLVLRVSNYLQRKRKPIDGFSDYIRSLEIESRYMELIDCFITSDKSIYYEGISGNGTVMDIDDQLDWLHQNILEVIGIKSQQDHMKCFYDLAEYKIWKAFPEIFPDKIPDNAYIYMKNFIFDDITELRNPNFSAIEKHKIWNGEYSRFKKLNVKFKFKKVRSWPNIFPMKKNVMLCNAIISFDSSHYRTVIPSKKVSDFIPTKSRYQVTLQLAATADTEKDHFRRYCFETFKYYISSLDSYNQDFYEFDQLSFDEIFSDKDHDSFLKNIRMG